MAKPSMRMIAVTATAFIALGSTPSPAGDTSGNSLVVAWNTRGGNTGMIGAVSTDRPWAPTAPPLEVGPNATMRFANDRLYVLNSADESIRVVDPHAWRVERTVGAGLGGTPVDIAVTSPSTAYVTLADSGSLMRVDLATGQASEAIDLRSLSGPGVVPELGTMAAHNGRLFVQVRRFDRDDPAARPYLAVVDLATETLVDVDAGKAGVQSIELAGTAPKGKMQVLPQDRRLYVNASGGFFDAGGIEAVDLDALRSTGLIVREADGETAADLNAFIMLDGQRGYLTFSTDLLLSSHLHKFTADGEVDPEELDVAVDYFTAAMAFDPLTQSLYVPTGGFGADGVNVFDALTGGRLTATPIPTGGPPTDLVLIPEPAGMLFLLVTGFGITATFRRRHSGGPRHIP